MLFVFADPLPPDLPDVCAFTKYVPACESKFAHSLPLLSEPCPVFIAPIAA